MKAMFGAGCFWGVEAAFQNSHGVTSTAVGYSGGHTQNPSYEDVCSGSTGHAEVVFIEYDSSVVSYEELLDVFWSIHDPTTPYRQGPDVGEQYRSVIFYFTPEQKVLARQSRDRLQSTERFNDRRIVTEIEPAKAFYRAEDYHQRYLEKRSRSQAH